MIHFFKFFMVHGHVSLEKIKLQVFLKFHPVVFLHNNRAIYAIILHLSPPPHSPVSIAKWPPSWPIFFHVTDF
jgi:hypothetical protein